MSDTHAHHDAGHGGDHVPHVLPLNVYFSTWIALLLLTGVTVGASYWDVGSVNLLIALTIATVKACAVAAMFMHLWWDQKFHSVIIGSSIIFLAIFIAFTSFDTVARGRAEYIEGDRPVDVSRPFSGTVEDEKIEKKWTPHAESPTTEPHAPH